MTKISTFFYYTLDSLKGAPVLIQVVAGALAILAVMFFFGIFLRGIWTWMQFGVLVSRLRRFKKSDDKDPSLIFQRSWLLPKAIAHLWTEYKDTLHEQRSFDTASGTMRPAVLRATIPAGAIFTTETLVDSRLGTEFFKHLPGLFTGIG